MNNIETTHKESGKDPVCHNKETDRLLRSNGEEHKQEKDRKDT